MNCVRLIFIVGLCTSSGSLFGQVSTWSENAENGLANVRDFTSSDYSLIQSQIVSEGSYAFHLANPDFEDNWFEIDRTISVQSDTSLFFSSRLGTATDKQFAKVQLSTNGGNSWPVELYSQQGMGFPGEGSFSLKTVPLSDYAGTDVRIRFMYDFDQPGSAFTQTEPTFGWLIDDIQIATSVEKNLYSIGQPSPEETLYLELINRSRADAIAEAHRLASISNSQIAGAYEFFGIDTDNIVEQYEWGVANGCLDRFAQPLAFNERLLQMSELHSQDQHDNDFQGHVSSNNPPNPFRPGDTLGDRASRVGYSGSLGENVFASSRSVAYGHAAFEVDWGSSTRPSHECYNPSFAGQGMQNPAGHRANLHNANMKEAGIGVVQKSDGRHIVTQNLGSPGNAQFITGVVFEDINNNDFYDIGEGRSGVRIDVEGSGFYALSSNSGAYTIPVSENGTFEVRFSGGGVSDHVSRITIRNGQNTKVDYAVTSGLFGDFDNSGALDVADIDLLSERVRQGTNDQEFDLNDDGLVNQRDRELWVESIRATYFGDANLDGEFNTSDFVQVFQSGQYEDEHVANSTWLTGDFNGDTEFDTSDFVIAFQGGGFERGPRIAAAVPEPNVFLLTPLILLVCLRRRWPVQETDKKNSII